MCVAVHTSFLKLSQERFLTKQFLAKIETLCAHSSYFSGEGICSGFETKVSCPALFHAASSHAVLRLPAVLGWIPPCLAC